MLVLKARFGKSLLNHLQLVAHFGVSTFAHIAVYGSNSFQMVLFTLFWVTALIQRERRKFSSVHSGPDDKVEQRDEPVRSPDGKSALMLWEYMCLLQSAQTSTLIFMFFCIVFFFSSDS